MSANKTRLIPTLGGVAVVVCLHDREKRQVVTEQQVVELGKLVGQDYDSRIHNIVKCACCENLFVTEGDEPLYCYVCRTHPFAHQQAPNTTLALPNEPEV